MAEPRAGEPPSASTLLAGTTMLVAGVGPGLGSQICRAAAAAGAAVMMGARSTDFGTSLASELRGDGERAAFRRCDVTSERDCADLVAAAVDEFGGVDSVVLNAMATGQPALTLEEGGLDEWQGAFDVNFFGSLRVVKAAIPQLKASNRGSVVFIGSQIVRRVFPGRGPYAASKAALLTAAQVLAKELGPAGIRVNTVVPGRMWGPSLQRAIPRLAAERGHTVDEEVGSWVDATALKRLATDEECGRAVIFLASEMGAAITGQTLDANAGETMQ